MLIPAQPWSSWLHHRGFHHWGSVCVRNWSLGQSERQRKWMATGSGLYNNPLMRTTQSSMRNNLIFYEDLLPNDFTISQMTSPSPTRSYLLEAPSVNITTLRKSCQHRNPLHIVYDFLCHTVARLSSSSRSYMIYKA